MKNMGSWCNMVQMPESNTQTSTAQEVGGMNSYEQFFHIHVTEKEERVRVCEQSYVTVQKNHL